MTDYLTNLPKELLVIITEHPDLKSDDVMSIAQLNRKLDGMFSIIKPIWQREKAGMGEEDWVGDSVVVGIKRVLREARKKLTVTVQQFVHD